MSDETMTPPEGPTPGGPGVPPSVPPVIPPDPTLLEGGFAPQPPKRRPLAYAAVVIGLVALAGGATFFARSVGTYKGAGTPEAAVQRMFDALSNEDFLGVLTTLRPGERSALTGRIKAMSQELGRLKILSSDLDLGDVHGIDLSFTGLTYRTASLSDRISAVVVTGGRATYRIDPRTSPLGDFVRGLMGRGSGNVVSGTEDIANDQPTIVAVQDGGKWYVSLGYSIAEQVRRDAGLPVPTFGAGVPANGAASPEAAVDQFLRAAVRLDVRKLIELMPSGEAGALHDYAPLFLSELENKAKEARSSFRFSLRTLDLSSRASGDEALVKIDKIVFDLSIPSIGVSAEYDGKCLKVEGAEAFLGSNAGPLCGDAIKGITGGLNVPTPEIGIVTVREGGAWFVSPIGTVFDAMVGVFKALKPSDLENLKQMFGLFAGNAGSSIGGYPTSIPIPLPS